MREEGGGLIVKGRVNTGKFIGEDQWRVNKGKGGGGSFNLLESLFSLKKLITCLKVRVSSKKGKSFWENFAFFRILFAREILL